MTKKYGTVGFPAKQSLSPVIQNAAFKEVGYDAQFGTFEVPEHELKKFIEEVKKEPISGCSVTMPHKEPILPLLDVVDDDAKAIGAVNTVVNKGGFLYGYNTDGIGAVNALKKAAGSLKGKRAMVIGAGGASRAIVYWLLKSGAQVLIVNRNIDRAEDMVKEFSEIFGENVCACYVDDKSVVDHADVLVQATSIWMLEPNLPEEEVNAFVPDTFVEKFDVVMDIVYKPIRTPLIKKAERLGKKVVTGEKMLLHQGVEQFKLWTGMEAPAEVMREALENVLD